MSSIIIGWITRLALTAASVSFLFLYAYMTFMMKKLGLQATRMRLLRQGHLPRIRMRGNSYVSRFETLQLSVAGISIR